MAAMMKKQMLASTTTKRCAVVAQAKTVKASKTVDSAFYGPNRGQFLGPFSESPLLYQPSLHLIRLLILSPHVHVILNHRMRNHASSNAQSDTSPSSQPIPRPT